MRTARGVRRQAQILGPTLMMVSVLGVWAALLVGPRVLQAQAADPPLCDDGVERGLKDLVAVKACSVPSARRDGPSVSIYKTTQSARLKDEVTVLVRGFAKFKDTEQPPVDLHRLVLFLDGKPVKGPPVTLPEMGSVALRFTLFRNADNREAWNALLSGAIRQHAVSLSVGFEGQSPIKTEVDDFQLVAIPPGWVTLWLGLFVALVVLLVWAAKTSYLLRDGAGPPGPSAPMYSLARTQMAFWFVVVMAAYMFIWLVTGELNTLTATVVGLMGISAATAVAGNTIDAGKQAAVAAAVVGAPVAPAAPAGPIASRGFFQDILSDEHGISLARVQIAAWTVVLGIIFARSVYQDLAMPQFDATLLGLMGISNGTYIGFKGLEK
jgi:hypothetical protein